MKRAEQFARVFMVVAVIGISRMALAQNAVPMLINYQGELKNPSTGEGVADGFYDMVFRIYDAETGGTAVWTGTYSTANGSAIEVKNGRFSVILGSGTGNAFDSAVFSGAERWLEIEVGTEKLSPRQRVTSVPYSMVGLGGAQVIEDYTNGSVLSVVNTHPAHDWDDYPVAGWFETQGADGAAVVGIASLDSGWASGGTFSAHGTGVQGNSSGETGFGVSGYASGDEGTGVIGEAPWGVGVEGRGAESGVFGWSYESSGVGVRGINSSTDSSGYLAGTYGVYGQASTTTVWGHNTSTGNFGYLGGEYGVYGASAQPQGTGVYSEVWGDWGAGVLGHAVGDNSVGVSAEAFGLNTRGVCGVGTALGGFFVASDSGCIGVRGNATGNAGIGVAGWTWGAGGSGVHGETCGTSDKVSYGGHFKAWGARHVGIYAEGGRAATLPFLRETCK